MTHISRPFQIALVALLLFIAVWFAVLRGHSSSTGSSGSGSSASSTPASGSSAQSAASQSASSGTAPGGGTAASQASGAQHSSAPGVDGLSRAILRARGAVAQSQQNAQQLQKKSEQASSGAQQQGAQTQSSAQSQGASQSKTHAGQQPSTTAKTTTKTQANGSAQAKTKTASGAPTMQVKVEGELQHGKIVAVLFWNPKGSVDAVVRRELQAAKHDSHGKLAIHVARSGEVGSFGSFTHTVQVYSTPTILLINTKGQTSSLTGLTDAFSIEQAVREVKSAK